MFYNVYTLIRKVISNMHINVNKCTCVSSLRVSSLPPVCVLAHLPVESGDDGDVPVEDHLLHGSDEQDAGVHGHPR